MQRFLATLKEQIKLSKSLVYRRKKEQNEWLAQEKQEYVADDINFFVKRNGARAQKARRKLFSSGEPGPPQETQESDVYGLNDQTEATLKQALAAKKFHSNRGHQATNSEQYPTRTGGPGREAPILSALRNGLM